VLFMPRGSSFRSTMVLGVGEGQPMRAVTCRNRETDEKEQVAPRVVRQVAPPVVLAKREPEFRGSQPRI
jgi:hypothetical protein